MKPLRIDFAKARVPPRWAWMLCAGLAAAAAAAVGGAVFERRQVSTLRLQISALERQQQVRAAEAMQPLLAAAPPPYESDARRALREAEFATAQALTVLERIQLLGVTPVSVELQADTGLSRLEVEFGDHSALLDFLEELNRNEDRPRWHLLRASAKTATQFTGTALLEARW